MMTATAGILSAATGMLVTLNQTGIVDLRQLAGGKPAAQSSTLETPSSALRTEDKPPTAKPEIEKNIVEAKKQEDQPQSAPPVQDNPARPAPDAADRRVEAKMQGSTAPSVTPAGGDRNPAPETPRRVAESTTVQEPPPSVWPAQDMPMRPNPIPERVAEAKKQQEPTPASATRPTAAKEPGADTERKPEPTNRREERVPSATGTQYDGTRPKPIPERVAEAKKQQESTPASAIRPADVKEPGADTDRKAEPTNRREERAPSATGTQNDGTRPRPEPSERVADARKQEETPTAKHPSDHDVKKPEVLRHSREEPRAVGKAKAPATEPPDKKNSETANEAKKDKRQVAQAEPKQPEKTPGLSTAPPTKGAAPTKGTPLKLTGLAFTVPGSWTKEELTGSPMGSVATIKIPKTDPGGEDGVVRITHNPNMKGKDKDEVSIDRWISQVAKPDGSPMTRTDTKITTAALGAVRLTVVDMTGSVKMTMRDSAKSNQRMIAAIVDHPQGPHFVVTAGPVASMEKWAAQIDAFLKSAKSD